MSSKAVVAVAMSGGVDSSVAAALLVERGYRVFGIMLRLWSEPDESRTNRCCTPDAVAMARRVAAILSIPFYVIDARKIFYEAVVQPFIDGYTHNITPNPCIACNRLVRWRFLLDYARSAGADYLATGHYARLAQGSDHAFRLLRGVDPRKDQSYVLHVLGQYQLGQALFPLGEFFKTDVRKLAQKFDLPVAERPDSQDLCFAASRDYRPFLLRHAPQAVNPGDILDRQGSVIGQHQGLAFYTIGQRKGLGAASPTPLYVLEKDVVRNALVVGPHAQAGASQLMASQANWVAGEPPASPFTAQVMIRYKAQEAPGTVEVMKTDAFKVQFEQPILDITPGQAAVLYNGKVCLGGGIITGLAE